MEDSYTHPRAVSTNVTASTDSPQFDAYCGNLLGSPGSRVRELFRASADSALARYDALDGMKRGWDLIGVTRPETGRHRVARTMRSRRIQSAGFAQRLLQFPKRAAGAAVVLPVASALVLSGSAAASATTMLELKVDQAPYYGGRDSPSMVSTHGGNLILAATRTGNAFLSSEVQTDYFTYGTVTVRAKLSAGIGMWPAIWMVAKTPGIGPLGTPEIDVNELPQSAPGQTTIAHFTYHWTGADGVPWAIGTSPHMPFDMTKGIHTYRLAWTPDSITWWVDNVNVMHVEADPERSAGVAVEHAGQPSARVARPTEPIPIYSGPMRLLLNNGVGSAGSWAGAPSATTGFPNSMVVQSISIRPLAGMALVGERGQFRLTSH